MNDLIKDLVRDEGLRLKPYTCPGGKLTIGVGRNIQERGISESEALYLLKNDIDISKKELSLKFEWFCELNENRKRSLINMHFNLGMTRLLSFKKFLKAMGEGNFEEASKEALDSKWAKQVGDRAKRISELIRKG